MIHRSSAMLQVPMPESVVWVTEDSTHSSLRRSPEALRGCAPADLGTAVRCFGENTVAKHLPCTRETRFAVSAKHSMPCQRLVRQRLANPDGAACVAATNVRPRGSDPPEIGPRLHKRSFRGGRSRDLSLQEGRAAPRAAGGVRRGVQTHPAPLARLMTSSRSRLNSSPSPVSRHSTPLGPVQYCFRSDRH